MEVSGQIPAKTALTPREEHWRGDWLGLRADQDHFEKKKSFPFTGIRTPDRQARSLVTILTRIFQLMCHYINRKYINK